MEPQGQHLFRKNIYSMWKETCLHNINIYSTTTDNVETLSDTISAINIHLLLGLSNVITKN